MALKGADGLVKMYAMVNVQRYNIVETGGTVAECESNYRKALANEGLIAAGNTSVGELQTQSGTIQEIRTAVIDGSTHYYVRIRGGVGYLDFNGAELPRAVLLDVGDTIWYQYSLNTVNIGENVIISAVDFWFQGETQGEITWG
jgi:hypothetical protein